MTATLTAAAALTPELFARLACDQPTLTFLAAYDSHGTDLTDPRWLRWMTPTVGPSAAILITQVRLQLVDADRWKVPPKLLAALLGIGRPRLATAIARSIRYGYIYPHHTGALALDLRPTRRSAGSTGLADRPRRGPPA